MPAPALILRPASPDELKMISHDWFLSYRRNSKAGQLIRQDVYDKGQNALIAHLLETCPPIVATFPTVPDEVVGWVCRDLTAPTTHYVYTKFDYRRTGIAMALAAGTRYHTHNTRAGEPLFRKLGSLYNPYLTGSTQ